MRCHHIYHSLVRLGFPSCRPPAWEDYVLFSVLCAAVAGVVLALTVMTSALLAHRRDCHGR